MSLNRHIICTNLFLILASVQAISDVERDILVDEYYGIIIADDNNITPQDLKDAQEIWDKEEEPAVVAGILLYREKSRRNAINRKIVEMFVGDHFDARMVLRKDKWINPCYTPQWFGEKSAFLDLCYGLSEEENFVLSGYLEHFFKEGDKAWIIIALVLTKNMENLKQSYDCIHFKEAFKEARKSQKRPFENMLRIWVRKNRELPEEKLDQAAIRTDAEKLKTEQDNGCFRELRSQIEEITMWKSIPYARAVFEIFEGFNGNKPTESIVEDCEKNHGLNHDLGNTYFSLVRYIKNKHDYIATLLYENCDESNWYPAWVLCISVVHPQEWPKVNEAFLKRYKSKANSLSDFILKKLTNDKIMAEAIAVIVDHTFKPTIFKEIPVEDGSGKPPPPPPA